MTLAEADTRRRYQLYEELARDGNGAAPKTN